MSDWEYLELHLIHNLKGGYWHWSDTKLHINVEDRLDEMGAVGWELVSTYTVIKSLRIFVYTSQISYVFKRPLE